MCPLLIGQGRASTCRCPQYGELGSKPVAAAWSSCSQCTVSALAVLYAQRSLEAPTLTLTDLNGKHVATWRNNMCSLTGNWTRRVCRSQRSGTRPQLPKATPQVLLRGSQTRCHLWVSLRSRSCPPHCSLPPRMQQVMPRGWHQSTASDYQRLWDTPGPVVTSSSGGPNPEL